MSEGERRDEKTSKRITAISSNNSFVVSDKFSARYFLRFLFLILFASFCLFHAQSWWLGVWPFFVCLMLYFIVSFPTLGTLHMHSMKMMLLWVGAQCISLEGKTQHFLPGSGKLHLLSYYVKY